MKNILSECVADITQPILNWRNITFRSTFEKNTAWHFFCVTLILSQAVVAVESLTPDEKRPIWNIAHMVNAIAQIDDFLSSGTNGLEFDISFDSKGNPSYTYHGVPCDCFRDCIRWEYIDTYLDYMRQLTTPGNKKFRKQLVLLDLDLKMKRLSSLAVRNAAKNLANKLINLYWKNETSETQAYLLITLPSLEHIEFISTFQQTLKNISHNYPEDKIGYTFLGNQDVRKVDDVLRRTNASYNIWQADGSSNCFARGYERLERLLDKRNESDSLYFNKVFWWTVDRTTTMEDILSLGIDAIVTNYPSRLADVLREKSYSNTARLADIGDNPWRKFP